MANKNETENEYSYDFLSFYQVEGVNFLLDNKRVLIADDMGVGKTAQAIAGKLEIENSTGVKSKTLVIAPNNVKRHWAEKIDEYCERKQSVVKLDDYSEESLSKMKDADFVIVNYDIFGRRSRNAALTERLINEGFRYVILDEVHNVKNPSAFRSDKIKRISDNAEYLCLLSGTPIPNGLADIYMLISLLDKDAYKTPESVRRAHWDQPKILRAVLQRKRLRREMSDIATLPPILYNTELEGVLEPNEQQREVYNAIFDNDELEGSKKLLELRKALLDPPLVDPWVIFDKKLRRKLREISSSKYEALDKIIEERSANGEKVVVFSPLFKRKVTKKLEERHQTYDALRIDGDVPEKEREGIRKSFQYNPNNRVLIATTATTGEGISLNAASTVVLLDEPYTPAEREQAIKRVYRRGQKRKVDVISLAVKDSIDEGVLELLKWKKDGIDFIEKGRELKPEHLEALVRDWRSNYIFRRLYSPQQKIRRYSSRMMGKGSERVRKALIRRDSKIAKDYAENYCKDWETSYSANTARVYKQIIEGLYQTEILDNKIDLGSGPGILSHILGEKTTNVDLNEHHFKQSIARPDNINIVSSIHELPVRNGSFDLALSSMSLYYLSNEEKEGEPTEIEKAIREVNRILRKDGYFILALPYNVLSLDGSKYIEKGLSRLGFEIIPELTGYVESAVSDVDFRTYVCVSKKIGIPSDNYNNLEFELEKRKRIYTMRKKGICNSFVYFNPTSEKKEKLEERLERYMTRIK